MISLTFFYTHDPLTAKRNQKRGWSYFFAYHKNSRIKERKALKPLISFLLISILLFKIF